MEPLSRRRALAVLGAGLAAPFVIVACGESSSSADSSAEAADPASRLVSAADGSSIQANPPDDLIILDVRTPEEFAEQRLDGAILVDFYDEDFATQLSQLDPDASYLLYCRSGNRSGQTRPLMEELGFIDVAEIDGGINAWNAAQLPTVSG